MPSARHDQLAVNTGSRRISTLSYRLPQAEPCNPRDGGAAAIIFLGGTGELPWWLGSHKPRMSDRLAKRRAVCFLSIGVPQMKNWVRFVMTCCLSITVSGAVDASCLLSDLDGAWRVYAWGGSGTWSKCTIEVAGGTGQIAPNRVCEDGDGNFYLTTGGQLYINDVCRVSGFVDTQVGRITIRHSFLEANLNQIWTGVAVVDADGSNLMFTGVRGLSTGGYQ